MPKGVDLRVCVDGVQVPLPAPVAAMVLAVVDLRETIRAQTAGTVMLDYRQAEVTLSLLRRHVRVAGRRLEEWG